MLLFWEEKRFHFYEQLLEEMALARKKQRESAWPKEILIYLKVLSMAAIILGTDGLKTQKKLKPSERTSF